MTRANAAIRFSGGALSALLAFCACRGEDAAQQAPLPSESGSSRKAPSPPTSQSAAPAAPPVSKRCRPAGPAGSGFTVGDLPGATDDDDDGLPFAVDLGGAVIHEGRFVVSALRQQAGGTHAIVVLLSAQADGGRVVDLGQVHGFVVPPRLASNGRHLMVAVVDSDASAMVVRLARIDAATSRPNLAWGPEIPQARDESEALELELGAQRGLLVWDEWDDKANHGVVVAAAFDPTDLSKEPERRILSEDEQDAESPRLMPRPGGYYAAWVVNAPPERDRPPRKKPKSAKSKRDDEASAVELGPRWIVLRPLDVHGAPSSASVMVTPKTGHALSFDAALSGDRGTLVAYRDDTTSPATPGGALRIAHVAPGGSVELQDLGDFEVGAAVPGLLVDAHRPKDGAYGWLSIGSAAEATLIAALDDAGKLVDDLAEDALVRSSVPLLVDSGRTLLARPRGRAVELSIVQCQPGQRAATRTVSP